jgi:hypothetical protein
MKKGRRKTRKKGKTKKRKNKDRIGYIRIQGEGY